MYYMLNFSKLRIKLGLKPLEVPDSTEDKGEKLADSWLADSWQTTNSCLKEDQQITDRVFGNCSSQLPTGLKAGFH